MQRKWETKACKIVPVLFLQVFKQVLLVYCPWLCGSECGLCFVPRPYGMVLILQSICVYAHRQEQNSAFHKAWLKWNWLIKWFLHCSLCKHELLLKTRFSVKHCALIFQFHFEILPLVSYIDSNTRSVCFSEMISLEFCVIHTFQVYHIWNRGGLFCLSVYDGETHQGKARESTQWWWIIN